MVTGKTFTDLHKFILYVYLGDRLVATYWDYIQKRSKIRFVLSSLERKRSVDENILKKEEGANFESYYFILYQLQYLSVFKFIIRFQIMIIFTIYNHFK